MSQLGFYLYFITTDDGFLAVGLAANVERRLYDLQRGNHRPLSCLATTPFPYHKPDEAVAAERMIRDELSNSHERGLWYRMSSTAERLIKAAEPYEPPDGVISRGRRSAATDPDRHPRSSVRWSEVKWPEWMDEVDRRNMVRLHRTPGAVRDAVRRLSKRYRNRQ